MNSGSFTAKDLYFVFTPTPCFKGSIMNKFQTALAAAGLALASSGANAAIVNLSGDTVMFSFDDAFLSTTFGSYSVVGDTLSFSPTTFIAEKESKGIDIKSATTPLINVTAKAGYALTELDLFEQGDYFRIEDAVNNTVVAVGGQFIVNDVPDSITSTEALDQAIPFTDLANGFATTTWNAENYAYLDFAESATVKVQNILIAAVATDSGLNAAFIEKKLMNITAFTTPVPVPGAFWLFGSALTGVLVSRRRAAA